MIRRIVQTDRDTYISLAREFYHSPAVLHPVPEKNFIATFDEMMRADSYTLGFLFELEQQPLGYALTAKTFSQEAGGFVLWIEEVYLRPEGRGKGMGSAFFRFLEGQYQDEFMRFRLEVDVENTQAFQLYERLGYTRLDYIQMIKEFSA